MEWFILNLFPSSLELLTFNKTKQNHASLPQIDKGKMVEGANMTPTGGERIGLILLLHSSYYYYIVHFARNLELALETSISWFSLFIGMLKM